MPSITQTLITTHNTAYRISLTHGRISKWNNTHIHNSTRQSSSRNYYYYCVAQYTQTRTNSPHIFTYMVNVTDDSTSDSVAGACFNCSLDYVAPLRVAGRLCGSVRVCLLCDRFGLMYMQSLAFRCRFASDVGKHTNRFTYVQRAPNTFTHTLAPTAHLKSSRIRQTY